MNELSRQRFRFSAEQVSSLVSDETVILNHDRGVYYGLSEVGTTLWQALESGPQSFDALCHVVMVAYEVDRQTCETDVTTLLHELIGENLVETEL